jgi:hypothetical protein
MIDADIYANALERALRERNTLNDALSLVQAECTRMKGELEKARAEAVRPVHAETAERPKENGPAARMTPARLDRLAGLMRAELVHRFPGISAIRHEPWDAPPSTGSIAGHLLFVCEGIEIYAEHVRRNRECCTAADGARRVEFVQGALFALGWATLKDIEEWNGSRE